MPLRYCVTVGLISSLYRPDQSETFFQASDRNTAARTLTVLRRSLPSEDWEPKAILGASKLQVAERAGIAAAPKLAF